MMTDKMAVMAQEAIEKAIGLVWNYDEKIVEERSLKAELTVMRMSLVLI